MVRGINRQTIFEDAEDCDKFINTIQQSKEKSGFDLYGYCLMGNHVHLLLKVKESLALLMQNNWKYDRIGHLFQERYKSEVVENEAYLLTVLRYIHQNPIKARMTNRVEGYKWSSYHEYIGKQRIIDIEYILDIFGTERQTAKKRFEEYMNEVNQDVCLDYEERHRIADEEVMKLMEEKYGVKKGCFHLMERKEIDSILRSVKAINGVTIRQLVRITGVSKSIVEKA